MPKSISQKVIHNTIFNATGRFVGIIVALFMTPYIIGHIGVERFGIWAIVGVLTGFAGMLDFGVGMSFVKYTAEFFAKKDFIKINEFINTGFVFYSFFAVIISITAFVATEPILTILRIPEFLHSEAMFVIITGIILYGITNALSPFSSVLEGLQRMDISNMVNIVVTIPNILGTIFFLEKGYGLSGLIINNVINSVLMIFIKIFIVFRIMPEISFNPFLFKKNTFRKLFDFGYKLQISRLAYLFNFQTDKLIITYFLGIGVVSFYQLGTTILQRVREIPLLMVSAIVPAVSEIEVTQGSNALQDLYLRGSKYLIFISTPLLFFIIINSSIIMLLWMGKGYEMAIIVIEVLSIGYFAATITGVASSLAVGIAKTEFEMRYGILMIPLNFLLSLILIIKLGFIGAVIGTSASLVIGALFFLSMFHNYLNLKLISFTRLFYKPILISALSSCLIIFLNLNIWQNNLYHGRMLYFAQLSINFAVYAVLYFYLMRLSCYFDERDNLFFKKIPVLGHIF